MPAHTVQFWVKKFKSSRVNVKDDMRIGRQREVKDNNTITAVLAALEDDRQYTIEDIQGQLKEKHCFNVSCASICWIVKEA